MPIYSLPIVSDGVWCMSVLQPGVILQGIEAIKQRVYIVLNTPLGTDPLRPLFGCGYHKYIDGNILTAPAKIKKEIIEAITIWVPEVKLGKITSSVSLGKLTFTIRITYQGNSAMLPFVAGRGSFFGGITGTKIINTGYKWYVDNLTPTLTVDGLASTPSVPGSLPWDDIAGMMVWIRANWGWAGTWGLGKDEVILYLDKKYKTAVLQLAAV